MKATVLGMVVLLLAAAKTATYQEQMNQFWQKAREERERLGNTPQLRVKYPTPEVYLAPAKLVEVKPGKTATVRAKGRLVKGSLVTFDCDELQLVKLKQTTSKIEAKVQAGAFALPRTCHLVAVTPVTAAPKYVEAVKITGSYRWTLALSNGMRAEWTTQEGEGGVATTGRWFDGETPLPERPVQLSMGRSLGTVEATTQWLDEDYHARDEADRAAQREQEPLGERLEAARAFAEKCKPLPIGSGRDACYKEYYAGVNKASDEYNAFSKERELNKSRHRAGCDKLTLTIGNDGTITGKATGCAKSHEADVTGKLEVSKT